MKHPGLLIMAAASATLGTMAAAWSEDTRPVAANIEGAKALAPDDSPDPAGDVKTAPDREIRARHLLGDASLRGQIDLPRATLHEGRYQIPLADGRTARLTLDPILQAEAESVLDRAKAPMGAVVVMSVDGRILALAGRQGDRPAPELATSVWAPAASIFKLVTAAALVDAGVRPETQVCYHGGFRAIGAANLSDDPKRDTQCNDLAFAVARSQNAVIAKLVHRYLKPEALRRTAAAFGFGSAPGFALQAAPARAEIPDKALDFARVAAGFWQTDLSPLGGALVANIVASGGMARVPQVVDAVVDDQGELPVLPGRETRVIDEHVARDVAFMMIGTTESGTAHKGFHDQKGRKFLPEIEVAGKTGTLTRSSPSYLQYSWFVGFAPADSPEVTIAVLLGNPERWHLKAHTAARMVLQKAF